MRLFVRELFHFVGAVSAVSMLIHFGLGPGWAAALVWAVLAAWEAGNVIWGTQTAWKTWADCVTWNAGILVGAFVFPD